MRGKEEIVKQAAKYGRITPAYAGKSVLSASGDGRRRDHPRLCGEKQRDVSTDMLQKGSPPPMRGKAPQFYFSQIVYRITPAYAGKSLYVS